MQFRMISILIFLLAIVALSASSSEEQLDWNRNPKENATEVEALQAQKNLDTITAEIESPSENENVSEVVYVSGSLSRELEEDEFLWIAVKPLNSAKDWWPQNNGPKLAAVDRRFDGNAYLAGDNGDRFEIAILIVDEEIDKDFMDWVNTSLEEDDWPSITVGHPEKDQKVPKEVIEARKVAKVIVVLNK